jgi:DeoR family transcriptional regulator, fructose operon transcriptional repressor
MSARTGTAPTNDKTLYSAQRQQAILRTLRSTGRVDVADISNELSVTTETIRKDLIALERQGQLRRVHGGAVRLEELSFEPDVSARVQFANEKQRIAKAAVAHLPHSGTVLIDAGSTTSRLAEMMPSDRQLTVFTNTLTIALALVTKPNLTVYTLGGRVRSRTFAEVDSWAARTLGEINVDIAFLGTNGISINRGLTTPDPAEASIKRLMLGSARRRILLSDHSKVGHVATCKYGELTDIDLLITDFGLPSSQHKALQAAGLTVEKK